MVDHVSTLSQQTAALEAALKREADARSQASGQFAFFATPRLPEHLGLARVQAEADRAAAERRALAIEKAFPINDS